MTSLACIFYGLIIAQRGAEVDWPLSAESQPGLATGAGMTERRDFHRESVSGESKVQRSPRRRRALSWATASSMRALEKLEKAQKREP